MAKFSQAFLQGLLQPSYQEGLFTAARGIGTAPAMRMQQQQQAALQKGLFGLEQMAESGELTEEMLKEARGSYAALIEKSPEAAKDIRETLKAVSGEVETTQKEETAAKILELQDEIREIASSNLPREVQNAQIAEVQRQIREAAQNLSFAEQQALGARSEQIRRNAKQEERAAATFEMTKQRFDEWADEADLRDEQREVAFLKLQDYKDNGFIREAERKQAKMQVALPVAKRAYIIAGENEEALKTAKEQFLAQYPEMEVVWEEAGQQVAKGEAALAQSKETLAASKFEYTDEKLKEMGFTEEQINTIKAQPNNKLKNTMVYNTAKANLTKGGLPSATLANLFVKASRARAAEILGITRSTPSEKQKAEIDKLAAEIGLAAAQKAQETDDLTKGFAEIAGYQSTDSTDTTTSTTSVDSFTSTIESISKKLNTKE
jgi:hypothetical protein